ncbi:heme exporter protein CcmD [Dongia sedimenti]|uniref:Heme exporter protein D n=1 Tax=Dongia sedimenti TaxID=3064282 RepID=A0ABU0YL99_9PROT|nr:heme exporter protein CcmD [Rhodospirillaceae bacterium R-7]
MSEYFAMGGYAAFVWPSYGVAAILLVVLFLLSARRLRAAERALDGKDGPEDSMDPGA